MSYKSIVVCLDNSAGSTRRLDFALAFAAKHNAHLTGLHLTYTPNFYFDPYAQWAPMMVELEAAVQKKRYIAKEDFRVAAQKAGVNFDWADYRSTEVEQALTHARTADLTILGQRNPSDANSELGIDFQEKFVLKLGRPVLFFPSSGECKVSFDNIVVAWDGGREAARAMSDALPLLKLAKRVSVLTIEEKKDLEHDLPDVDIATYLAKHDVKMEIERSEDVEMEVADWLIARMREEKANLLVMGAYGHSRFTELVIGGTTRFMLRKMKTPVLMSH
jgi:nucleotide-binding universal stress UspA family protein